MNSEYLDKITFWDCRNYLWYLDNDSIDLFLSDIPYWISLDTWDVLHENKNSGLLGSSPAQLWKNKNWFSKRWKPINWWSKADKTIWIEYQIWCSSWINLLYSKMKDWSSLFIFWARRTLHRAILACEDQGFLLRDVLVWKKQYAHHRAQKLSPILEKRWLLQESKDWTWWKLWNLAPIYEPIAWLFKPYSKTVTDNVLTNWLGAMNIDISKINWTEPTNILEFNFEKHEQKIHEAQKPESLIKFLINLTTKEKSIILDPFMGSWTTAICSKSLNRHFIWFEMNAIYFEKSNERLSNLRK